MFKFSWFIPVLCCCRVHLPTNFCLVEKEIKHSCLKTSFQTGIGISVRVAVGEIPIELIIVLVSFAFTVYMNYSFTMN